MSPNICHRQRESQSSPHGNPESEWLQPALVAIVGDVSMQNGPKPLNRIEVGTVGRQLDQMDAASCPGKKSPDIGPFVVSGVAPDDMNNALVGVARFDPGQKLCCTDPINGCGLDKGPVEACLILNAAPGV